jgi:hypothetical protein
VTRTAKSMLAASALILLGSGFAARSEPVHLGAKATDGFSVRGDFNTQALQYGTSSKKTLQFDATKGRWGLKLDFDQPVDREIQLEDVRAGAFFKLTPALRLGGAVSLSQPDPKALISKAPPPEATPRVRLETAFKF